MVYKDIGGSSRSTLLKYLMGYALWCKKMIIFIDEDME